MATDPDDPDVPDDLDDLLDGKRAEIEARFLELEREAEIDRLRREAGQPARGGGPAGQASSRTDARPGDPGISGEQRGSQGARASSSTEDPLAGMKAALDSEGDPERYLLVICPQCEAKNRVSLTRVRTGSPLCGRCKQSLAFVKV